MTQSPVPLPAQPGGTRLVIVALVVALAAVVLVNLYVEMIRRQSAPRTFTVYFLETSIPAGRRLNKDDVRAEQVPLQFQGAFKNTVGEDGLASRLGEVLQRPAIMGQPLTADLFAVSAAERDDGTISTSKRRVPLRVNSRTLPGSLLPGMYVDIAAPFPSAGVKMVMERVQVRALGQLTSAEEASAVGPSRRRIGNYPTIEIDVTPDEALALSRIQQIITGDFELYLRNPADADTPQIPSGGINPDVLQLIGP